LWTYNEANITRREGTSVIRILVEAVLPDADLKQKEPVGAHGWND
jgi:hypothetical protein